MATHRLIAGLAALGVMGFCGVSWAQCTGIPSANTVCAGPATGSGQFAGRKLVPADLPVVKTPTVQTFTTPGTFQYTSPTSPAPAYIEVHVAGGGGGGGGGGDGGGGGSSSFEGWTANGGSGGVAPPGVQANAGAGGVGGANGADGTGVRVDRTSGVVGQNGITNSGSGNVTRSQSGGTSAWGGIVGEGGASGVASIASQGGPGAGGAGEQVIAIMAPGTYQVIVGAGGSAGTAFPGTISAGFVGFAGRVSVIERY